MKQSTITILITMLMFMVGAKSFGQDGQSQTKRTINVETAGTLPTLISDEEKYTIEELTLTGELNGTDFRLLRDMAGNNCYGQMTQGKLKVLDFSGARVVAGGDMYMDTGRIEGKEFSMGMYPEVHAAIETTDVLPEFIFAGSILESVKMSNSIVEVKHSTFSSCYKLVSATLPESAVILGDGIFCSCRQLKSVFIPSLVSSVGSQFVSGCISLESIVVDSQNATFDSRNNCNAIIEKASMVLVAGCNQTVIPDGIVEIGREAFEDSEITSINLPASLETISIDAFRHCTKLESITIPASVTTISMDAFYHCSNLKSIVVDPNNPNYDSRDNCNAVIETTTGKLLFGCLNSVIPEGVKTIGQLAFAGEITAIEIPSTVTLIEDYAFPWTVTSVKLMSETPPTISDRSFTNYKNATLIVPKECIVAYAFADYWKDFKNIVEVGDENINYSNNVAEAVDLGLSVKWASWNIGADRPEGYGDYFSWGEIKSKKDFSWDSYKWGTPPTKYTETDGIKTLEPCDDVAQIYWKSSWRMPTAEEEKELYENCTWEYTQLNSINGYRVTGPNGNSIFLPAAGLYDGGKDLSSVNSGGWYWSSTLNKDLYAKGIHFSNSDVYLDIVNHDRCDGHVIRPVYQNTLTIHVAQAGTLPDKISETEKYKIEELILTGELNGTDFRLIRDMAGCNYLGDVTNGQLKKLDISNAKIVAGGDKCVDTNHLPSWGGSFSCSFEEDDVLPEWLFGGCKLTAISLPNSLKAIEDRVFVNCQSMSTIEIPQGVVTIGALAFYDFRGLQNISVASDNQQFSAESGVLFNREKTALLCYPASKNDKVYSIPSGVLSIVKYAFAHNNNLISILFPDGITEIGNNAFEGCSKVERIVIPEGVISIGERAFYKSSISSVSLPSTLNSIGYEAFCEMQKLSSIVSYIQEPFVIDERMFTIGAWNQETQSVDFNPSPAALYVPVGTKSKYEAIPGWSKFAAIFEDEPNITFVDSKVKNLCVFNWDTNKDGELSKIEAAAVKDLGDVFKNNNEIESFSELQYFTGLTSINNDAFSFCSNLSLLTIPNGVTKIGGKAFHFCGNLATIVIPNSVTIIEDGAFRACTGLSSMIIPESVISIGYNPFEDCVKLATITVQSGNMYYDSRRNCNAIIEKSSNKLISGCKNTTIPYGVTEIADGAFSLCTGLTSIDIPNGVVSIGNNSFYFCTALSSISIPRTVNSISHNSFSFCGGLTSIAVEARNPVYDSREGCNAIIEKRTNTLVAGCKNTIIPNSVVSIGDFAFSGCADMVTVNIPDGVTSIGMNAFLECSALTSVTIPVKVSSIGIGAFSWCSSLTSVSLPNSVTSIEHHAFYQCNSLTSITSMITEPFEINENVFESDVYQNSTLYVPYGCIAKYAATGGWNKFAKTEVLNGDTETRRTIHVATAGTLHQLISAADKYKIKELTLSGELNGTDIHFIRDMAGVDLDNMYAEYQVTHGGITQGKLRVLDLSDARIVEGGRDYYQMMSSSSQGNFEDYAYTKTDEVSDYMFSFCHQLEELILPRSAKVISSTMFDDWCKTRKMTVWSKPEMHIKSVKVADGNSYYDSRDNCNAVIETTSNTLIVGGSNSTIPSNVTAIGERAFYDIRDLKSVTIPQGVTSIGDDAFKFCSGLTSVIVENGNNTYDSRNGCNAIIETATNKLIVGSNNTVIPDNVTSIIDYAFWGCSSLTSAVIPEGVAEIGNYTFYHCSGLTSVTIPASVTSIRDDAFAGCAGLTSLTIPNGVTSIGFGAFRECSGLVSLNIPNSVTEIGMYAFQDCSGLTFVSIPNKLTSIQAGVFRFCSSLTSIKLPSSVSSIGWDAFQGCRAVASITVENGNKTYDSRNNCNAIVETSSHKLVLGCKNTIIPNTVTSIGTQAFYNCTGLTFIAIPSSITSIDANTFMDCTSLKTITIPNSVTSIDRNAFLGCSSLISISIPKNVTSIGWNVFAGCKNLVSVTSMIVEPFDIPDYVFENNVCQNATLYVPAGCKAKYEAAGGWKKFVNIEEMALTPMDDEEEVGFDGMNENTNLSGTIIDNVYFNITPGNGGYDATDNSVVVSKPMTDEEIAAVFGNDQKDLFSDEVKNNFAGMVVEVPAGKGVVTVEAQTTGGLTLKVKIGNADPVEVEFEGKLKLKFPYDVTEPTYAYIFAGETQASVRARTRGENPCLRIYGISVNRNVISGDANGDGVVSYSDVVAVLDRIIGGTSGKFVEAAADVNNDGLVTIADALGIVDIINR